MNSLHFIFINGRGSSGKDTQAELLVNENPQAVRISTGDIYRGAKTPDGEYGKFYEDIKPYIPIVDNGGFVPDEVMLPIVGEVISGFRSKGKDTFVFTGFPRTVGQLTAVDSYLTGLKDKGEEVKADFINYAVREELSMQRASMRRSQAIDYGLTPRQDDDPAVVVRRLEAYRVNTEPMLHKLAREGRLRVIKSSGTIEEVHDRTERALGREGHTMEMPTGRLERRG